ncbi:MAG: DMT family transporter [Usitatibacteraceae bacterium]
MVVLNGVGHAIKRAVILAVAAEGVLTLMDATIKSLTPFYPTFQITFMRFAMGSVFALVLFLIKRPGWPSRETVRYNGLRSLLVVLTGTTFFFALSKLAMAEAMALSFVSPLFMALFGVLLLGERFDAKIAIALVAGIAGMTVIVSGRLGGGAAVSQDTLLGAGAVLVSAMAYALAMVMLRARAQVDPLATIVLFQNALPALLLAVPAATVWRPPTMAHIGMFLMIGALGVGGHTLLTHAFARAEAARLAPVHYVVLVWGIVFGFLFFAEVPTLWTLAGAALIVAATLLTRKQ